MISILQCKEYFYKYALDFFVQAGHFAASEPIFANHSPEQYFYIDCKKSPSFSNAERNMMKVFSDVSLLFKCHSCAFFSINLQCLESDRSQLAHDIHSMVHRSESEEGTICLFRNDDEMMLSFMGFGLNCILSDWYPIDDDYEELACKAQAYEHPQMTDYDYFHDFVHMCARDYYFTPTRVLSDCIPLDFFAEHEKSSSSRDDLDRIIAEEYKRSETEYGDNYVAYNDGTPYESRSTDDDLDLLLLDVQEDDLNNQFGDMLDEADSLTSDEGEGDDEYGYDDIDPEAFNDPVLLLKWLQSKDNKSS